MMLTNPFLGQIPRTYTSWCVDEMRGVWAVANEKGEITHHMPDATIPLKAHLANIWRKWYKRACRNEI